MYTLFSFPLQSYAVDEITQIYDKCITEIDQHLQFISQVMPQSQHIQILHALLESVMVARNSREIVTALACLQKVRYSCAHIHTHAQYTFTQDTHQQIQKDCLNTFSLSFTIGFFFEAAILVSLLHFFNR